MISVLSEAFGQKEGLVDDDSSKLVDVISVEGRVVRNRLHGKGLLWIKLNQRGDHDSDEATDADSEFAVVFDAKCYSDDVVLVSRRLTLGGRGCFTGVPRSCGKILDARSFTVFDRTSEDDDWLQRRLSVPMKDLIVSEPLENDGEEFCKYWLSNASCAKGRRCRCAHPRGSALATARIDYKAQLEARRASAAPHPDDPHSSESKQTKSHRSSIFAEWLIATFGMELLSRGVVDIAGGRGDLSFELSVKRGIPCTVVDYRCKGEELVPCAWPAWQLSRSQRLWLQANVPGLKGFKACQAYVASCQLRQCHAVIENNWRDRWNRWAHIVEGAGVVVGMHPDQATGGAVELACAFGLPFAVVPCCVFSDEFPDRILGSGPYARLVQTHEDLVSWLQAFSLGSAKEFLGFRGKNQVVFRTTTWVKGDAREIAQRDGQGGTDIQKELFSSTENSM